MHDDVAGKPMRLDLLAREPHVLGIALDGVDHRLRRALGEAQRGVAERGAEFEHAPRVGGRRQRPEQRAVVVRIGVAAVLGAVLKRRLAQGGEGIGRVLCGGHGKSLRPGEGE